MLKISRKNIWYLDQNNFHALVHRWKSPSDVGSQLLLNLMLKCLDFFPLPDYYLMISESRYNWCAVPVFGIPLLSWVSAGGQNGNFPPPGNWDKEPKVLENWSQQLNYLILAMTVLFSDMTLRLRKSRLHCCGVMQFWACVVHFLQRQVRNLGADISKIGLHCVTVTWQLRFTSSCGSRRLAARNCWRHLWQVMQRDNDCWLQ